MKKDKYNNLILKIFILLIGLTLSVTGLAFFHGEYLDWDNIPLLITLTAVSMLGTAIITALISVLSKNSSKKKNITASAISAVIYAVLLWGITYLINVVIGKEQLNVLAINIAAAVLLIYTGLLSAICFNKLFDKKILKVSLALLSLISFAFGSYTYISDDIIKTINKDFKAHAPILSVNYREGEKEVITDFDFYVSTKGNDSNTGTKNAPFLTIEKAVEAVRNTDKTGKNGITVCIEEGEYRVTSVVFTKEDSGTKDCPITYYGNGNVILNGGVTLNAQDFISVKEYPEIASRLTSEAQEKVFVLDLTKEPYSLSEKDWGKIYTIGSYNTAKNYDGDYTGPLYCELFVNDKRQTIARYPDEGFLLTEEVVSTGCGKESDGALTAVENWDEIRNPETDVYRINADLAKRIGSWKTLKDVWMFGYWKYDWADASTPIGHFEEDTRILSPKFVSLYGTKTDAPYYFFNILEELTSEGEWYLDREKGLLCLFTPENFSEAQTDLSLSLDCVIKSDADNLIFDGITVKGTRGDGISITGNNNTVKNCLIKNVAGNALIMTGYDNLAFNNEITHTGKGGIILTGGDTKTLSPGNCKADNNYIHDWSEIYLTYQPAITLNGVGNICSHNEMVNSPHEAVTYSGNNHIIEYNLIHDVCLLSDDAGAIYSGRSWIWYGNIIRYNCIYNVGSDGHSPDGIYLDDALSGQQVYGNLLINIPRYSIHLGGGRDLDVRNNIIINAGERAVSYDDRAREGALVENGWFTHAYKNTGDMWINLYNSPYKSDIWQEAFPQYKVFSDDFNNGDDPSFVANPANSKVTGNLIFEKNKSIGYISDAASAFSDISGNALYSLKKIDSVFTDAENGYYSINNINQLRETLPDFEEIPLDEIGRRIEH